MSPYCVQITYPLIIIKTSGHKKYDTNQNEDISISSIPNSCTKYIYKSMKSLKLYYCLIVELIVHYTH